MRFVVFLDIDGVLNTRTTVKRTPYGYKGIDDARVKILANAIEKCGGGDIVLSSDWKVLDRNHDDYRYLVSKLEQCELKISDHTIDKERKRGQGVKEYLELHPEIEEFVTGLLLLNLIYWKSECSSGLPLAPAGAISHQKVPVLLLHPPIVPLC